MSSLLVALQFGILALIVTRAFPLRAGPAFGVLLAAGGAIGAWALFANRPGNFNIRPEPKKGGRLVTGGPYRWVRHPMYLAVLLAAAAFCVDGGAAEWGAWVALASVLFAKALREERQLPAFHPEFAAYRRRTRAIFPFLL